MQIKIDKTLLLNSKNRIVIYLIGFAITYIMLSPLVLSPFYDYLLFHPDHKYHNEVDKPLHELATKFKATKQDLYIAVSEHKKIHAWYLKEQNAKRTFLISHGNGGNICYRLELIASLLKYGSVFIYDYEGYGKSDGIPSRSAICIDGLAAYDCLTKQYSIKPSQIILYGESLGCSVACQISKSHPVGGIILQSGWASLLEKARDLFGLLRLYPDWMFGEPLLDNVAVLSKPHAPLLLIHGEQDKVLPCRYSLELYAKACEPKTLTLIPKASHNDVTDADPVLYSQALNNFLTEISEQNAYRNKQNTKLLQ